MTNIELLFRDLGFTYNQYQTVVNDEQITLKSETLYKTFLNNASLLLHNNNTKEDIVKLVMSNHNITYLDLSKKVELFANLGYDKKTFFTMLRRCPKLVNLSEFNINGTLEKLKGLGYKEDALKSMIVECPELLQYDFDRIEKRFNIFKDFGYTTDEVIKITAGYPGVIGADELKFKRKLAYYNSIDLHDYIVNRPKDLIQSADLTYARYQYFITNDIEINSTTKQSLFKKESAFKKQYGIDKSILLKMWKFSDYKVDLSSAKKGKRYNTVLG